VLARAGGGLYWLVATLILGSPARWSTRGSCWPRSGA